MNTTLRERVQYTHDVAFGAVERPAPSSIYDIRRPDHYAALYRQRAMETSPEPIVLGTFDISSLDTPDAAIPESSPLAYYVTPDGLVPESRDALRAKGAFIIQRMVFQPERRQAIAAVLRAVRQILDDPARWTRHTEARDSDGQWVDPTSPEAAAYCVRGAVRSVIGVTPRHFSLAQALAVLAATSPCLNGVLAPEAVNDRGTHADVLTMLDEALAALAPTEPDVTIVDRVRNVITAGVPSVLVR